MDFESREGTRRPKTETWNKIAEEVDLLVDKLRKGIDPGIREAVISLRASGLSTDGSCEGHLSAEKKIKGPWIDIGQIQPEIIKRLREATKKEVEGRDVAGIDELRREVRVKLLQEYSRLVTLLDEFYRDRNVPYQQRLIVKVLPTSARVISQGVELQDLYPRDLQQKKLEAFRQEMNAFSGFLRNRYFSEDEGEKD